MGSRRALRNWVGGWATAKSAAQGGRKAKPILPQLTAARKTSRTGLVGLKPAEGFLKKKLFLFPSFLPFFLTLTSETIKPGAVKRPELDPKTGRHNN